MGSVADTAADLGRQVMEELKNQRGKYNNRKNNCLESKFST